MATSLCRASDWIHSPRVPRSCDRVRCRSVTTNAQFVFRLLSPIEITSLIGEGFTGATSDSAAGNGVLVEVLRSVDCITATNDGLPEKARFHHAYALLNWGIGSCVRTVIPYASVHRRISFAWLGQSRKLLEACGPGGGMTPSMDCTEFPVGTIGHHGSAGSAHDFDNVTHNVAQSWHA